MTDQLSGGLPFAPQPKGLGSLAGDYLHKARLWMDEHTPGMGMATSFMGGLGAAAPAAGINQQGGILSGAVECSDSGFGYEPVCAVSGAVPVGEQVDQECVFAAFDAEKG